MKNSDKQPITTYEILDISFEIVTLIFALPLSILAIALFCIIYLLLFPVIIIQYFVNEHKEKKNIIKQTEIENGQ